MVSTERAGAVGRDQGPDGSFEPRFVPSESAACTSSPFQFVAGRLVRDIQAQLPRTLWTGLTYGPIRKITDAVLDAAVVKIRDRHQVRN